MLGETTLNIGVIEGGRAPNVIADAAKAELLIRLVDDGSGLFQAISDAAGTAVQCEQILRIPALHMPAIPGFETCTVRFTTDAGILSESWGEPLLYGPGSISVAHTEREFISKSDLHQAVGDYKTMVEKLIGDSQF